MSALQHKRGHLDEETLTQLAEQYNLPLYHLQGLVSFYTSFRTSPPKKFTVQVCRDISCQLSGCQQLVDDVQMAANGSDEIAIETVSCLGRCDTAPAVNVNDHAACASAVRQPDWWRNSFAAPDRDQSNVWKCDPYKSKPEQFYSTVKRQIANQTNFAEFCPQQLKASQLRGMGGAGFPTGKKWELVAAEQATPKYVICNADESEPGTFKDRVILEQLPHLVLEGMLFAALTVGAEKGIVFLRHEYEKPLAAMQAAIDNAYASNILGENAAGSGQQFDVEIFVSPGGYILGEETALLEALEDKRGEPRIKPPYPGSHGLFGQPTLINNVETFALATSILHHGQQWWEDQGREQFWGLKFVSISGDVTNPGVYEIPIGTPVSELIEMAGGMKDGKELKAFLPGGASSPFLPASKVDTPLEFDAMRVAGSVLGTGAVVVISEEHNLFELATNLVQFFRNESCGKCVPCRLGSQQTVELLEAVQQGTETPTALDVIPEWASTLEQTSICGLGQVALTPILSMLKHFPDDVPEQHAGGEPT